MDDPIHDLDLPIGGTRPEKGCLYVAATPLGNRGDISYRALQVIKAVDVLLCEDTRTTGRLLTGLGVRAKRMLSYHEHNEAARAEQVLRLLKDGQSACLVSDAGTPLISDPGYRLVRAARQAGVKVLPLPGPSAVITALSVSGLPTDRFCFAGFVPKKQGARSRLWQETRERGITTVVYVPVRALVKVLGELATAGGDPEVFVMREATKMHEEYLYGRASVLYEQLSNRDGLKGEVTLVISGKSRKE